MQSRFRRATRTNFHEPSCCAISQLPPKAHQISHGALLCDLAFAATATNERNYPISRTHLAIQHATLAFAVPRAPNFTNRACCAISQLPPKAHQISQGALLCDLAFAATSAPNFTTHCQHAISLSPCHAHANFTNRAAVRSRNCRRKRTKFHKALCCAISRSPRQAHPIS